MRNKVVLPPYFNFTVAMLGSILFFYILYYTATITIPLTFSLLFSLFLYPFCIFLEKRKVPKSLAIILSMLGGILIITTILVIISTSVFSFSEELPEMTDRFKDRISGIHSTIEDRFNITSEHQEKWIQDNLGSIVQQGGKILGTFIGQTTNFFSNLLFLPIYMFFMLYYRHILSGFLRKIIDPVHQHTAQVIQGQILRLVQKYIRGLFTVIAIVAFLNIIGLSIIGAKHAVFFGVLAALLTIIPYIGVFIGSLLPTIYAFVMMDSIFYPLAIFAWFQIVQVLEGNFITPNIVGSQVSLNPLIAILAFVVGGAVWGISGMVLFVPLIAILKVILDNIPSLEPYGFLLGEGEVKKRKKKT